MRQLRVIILATLILTSFEVGAFTLTEEERLQIDLQEARARATDFRDHLRRLEKAAKDREQFAYESKQARQISEAKDEQARVLFIEKRNSIVPDDAIRERLEKEWDAQKLREDAKMDAYRRDFIAKKASVQQTIDREASIDANKEFELTP